MSAPIRIEGSTVLSTVAVAAIVRDDQGKEVGRASTTVGPDGPELGGFVLNVDYPASAAGRPGWLEVFTINPGDGSVQSVSRIPIDLER